MVEFFNLLKHGSIIAKFKLFAHEISFERFFDDDGTQYSFIKFFPHSNASPRPLLLDIFETFMHVETDRIFHVTPGS